MFAHQARVNGLQLRFPAEQEVRRQTYIDGPRLRQILINLLGNALKFTAAGTVELSLQTRPGSDRVVFVVSDTGPGISEAERAQLFQPFKQVGRGAAGGTGLGLAISRRIAEQMGGRLWVESTPGAGSRFFLELSLPTRDAVTNAPFEVAPAPVVAPRRVLVVDDTASNLRVMTLMLEREGHTVRTAPGANEAEVLFRAEHFDLIFMDLQMPGIDGFEATRRLRALEAGTGRRTPIHALTADARKELAPLCHEAGMDGILTKPVRVVEIRRLFATLAG
jgi:CheY-like chemotaxis protein